MRTPIGTFRTMPYLLVVLLVSAALAACGGGGGSTSPSGVGTSGPVKMNISLGGADASPSVSEIPASLLSPTRLGPASASSKPSGNSFLHVNVAMTGVAFIPVETSPPSDIRPPDSDGEPLFEGAENDFHPKFVVYKFSTPVWFDLKNPPTARDVAQFLSALDPPLPAGVYHKIRVYYQQVEVVVETDTGTKKVVAHRTANGHLDIHFKANKNWDADDIHVDDRGYLVIPVSPNHASGVDLYCVAINITGLKVHETGSGKIIIRPQVFAELARPVKYSIIGGAENVNHGTSSFDIRSYSIPPPPPTAPVFPTEYNQHTIWAMDNDVFDWKGRHVQIDDMAFWISAFRTGAYVEAIGVFNTTVTPMVFIAKRIFVTFPDVGEGVVDNGWRSDDTFILRLPTDNVVYPKPGKGKAYYDNLSAPYLQLDNTFIDNNVFVKARGYATDISGNPVGGIEAYWISVGP